MRYPNCVGAVTTVQLTGRIRTRVHHRWWGKPPLVAAQVEERTTKRLNFLDEETSTVTWRDARIEEMTFKLKVDL